MKKQITNFTFPSLLTKKSERLFSKLLLSVVFALMMLSYSSVSAQCQRITGGVFPTSGGNTNTVAGWTVGGTYNGVWTNALGRVNLGTNGLEFRRDAGTSTTLQQNLTGIKPSSVITITDMYWVKTLASNSETGFALSIIYNGTSYANIAAYGDTNPPVVLGVNGASASITALQPIAGATGGAGNPAFIKSANSTFTITLPAGIPASGALVFSFQAGTDPTEVRDIGMKSVSILYATPTTPTVSTTAASCASAASNVVTNYDSALTYSSTPAGLTVGTGGVITGGTNGTSYTITGTITTGCASVASTSFTRRIGAQFAATTISTQPAASRLECKDVAITALTVSATGTAPLSYQWYSNTTNTTSPTGRTTIAAATSNSYTPPSNVPGTRYYHVIVTGACGDVTSTISKVQVIPSYEFTTQPATTQTVCEGTAATPLSVTTTGSGTFGYQWYKNSANTTAAAGRSVATGPGANSDTYTPPTNVVGTLYYHVVVSGGVCAPASVASTTSRVIVNAPTTITTQPNTTQSVAAGATPTAISVIATGAGTLTYQWFNRGSVNSNTGGTLITGATSASYTPAATNFVGTTYYYVVVTGACGLVNSSVSSVIVTGGVDLDGDGIPDNVDLDDDNDGILDTDECVGLQTIPFANGGFETPVVPNNGFANVPQGTPGLAWKTTATDGIIEVWDSGHNGVPSAEGNQFAELNGTQVSTLYQEFTLNGAPGTVNWSIKHRGRQGTDVAAVKFGTTLATALASTRAATMSDNNNAWGSYNGVYTIAPGQTTLVIAFQSVSSVGQDTYGNFIDDVKIVLNQICVDTDGDGLANYLDTDSDNDGCPDATEAAGHYATTAILAGGSNGGSSANLGNTVNGNGIPMPPGTVGGVNGQLVTSALFSPARVIAGTTPPATQTANPGDTVTLTSNATADTTTTWNGTTPFAPNYTTPGNGTNALTYSWTKNGTTIVGATSATLTLTGVTAASAGTYAVTIRHPNNHCGAMNSTVLSINPGCYYDPNLNGGTSVPSNNGITLLKRAGVDNGNWPMVRSSAFTVLESNTKGFVITRMTTTQVNAIVAPQEGMMVYDTTVNCLKLYDGVKWDCFDTATCP